MAKTVQKNEIVQIFVAVILIIIFGSVATIIYTSGGAGEGMGRTTWYYNPNNDFSENNFDGKAAEWDNWVTSGAVNSWNTAGYITVTCTENGIGYWRSSLTMTANEVKDKITLASERLVYRVSDNECAHSIVVSMYLENITDNVLVWTDNGVFKKSSDWTTIDNAVSDSLPYIGVGTYRLQLRVNIVTLNTEESGNTTVDITQARLGITGYEKSFGELVGPSYTTFIPIIVILTFVSLLVYAAYILLRHLGVSWR